MRRFPKQVLATLRDGKVLKIRAGTRAHRFLGIWVVVAQGRVFVRSWSLRPEGWYRALLEEPSGAILVGGREIAVRTRGTRSEMLKRAVDHAYVQKYSTPASIKWARGLASPKRRNTTTELLPA